MTPLEVPDARAREAYMTLVKEIHQRMLHRHGSHG
jgi:hypothetical protein